ARRASVRPAGPQNLISVGHVAGRRQCAGRGAGVQRRAVLAVCGQRVVVWGGGGGGAAVPLCRHGGGAGSTGSGGGLAAVTGGAGISVSGARADAAGAMVSATELCRQFYRVVRFVYAGRAGAVAHYARLDSGGGATASQWPTVAAVTAATRTAAGDGGRRLWLRRNGLHHDCHPIK